MLPFDPRYGDFGLEPPLDLLWVGALEEELDCLSKVGGRLFDRRPLTGHVQLGQSAAYRPRSWVRDYRRSLKTLVLSQDEVREENGKSRAMRWPDVERLFVKEGLVGYGSLLGRRVKFVDDQGRTVLLRFQPSGGS